MVSRDIQQGKIVTGNWQRTLERAVDISSPIEVFYCYSHVDEKLRDELEKHLSLLRRQGYVTTWYDRKIVAGQEWADEVDTHLSTAQIILLLISPDFLNSDYCYSVEMRRAVERHEQGEAKVIPIILRPVSWWGAPFGKLQVLPKDAKPITSWPDQDEAFLDVEEGICKAVEELGKAKQETKATTEPTNEAIKNVSHSEKKIDDLVYISVNNQRLPVDWEEALSVIKNQITVDKYENIKIYIGKLYTELYTDELQKINQSQKKVDELKQVHGYLHELEVALSQLDELIQYTIRRGKALDLEYIEENWRNSVLTKIKSLVYFASKEMRFLQPPCILIPNELSPDEVKGPAWIQEITELRVQFEAILREQRESKQRNDKVVAEQSHYLLETSHKYMYIIDQQLKDEIKSLRDFSQPILQGAHDGSTNS